MIPFSRPYLTGKELDYIREACSAGKLSGDGDFTKKCHSLLSSITGIKNILLTTSGTHALDMIAHLLDIRPGDEVIMPSFSFSSTANAFVLRGARAKFVDIRPDTLNIDETKIEEAITKKTKAVCAVHYAGVICEMDALRSVCDRHKLFLVEDAAQAIGSSYKGKSAGSFGLLSAVSFHDTKNIHCGEGGALLITDNNLKEKAEILREKGTNRSKFLRGAIDKYTWVGEGSSYLPSELNAAFLLAQIEKLDEITSRRVALWQHYNHALAPLAEREIIGLPFIPEECRHNGHIFYIMLDSGAVRDELILYLREHGVQATFHYIPLHSAPAGKTSGSFVGEDRYTTSCSECLLRLPLWVGMEDRLVNEVAGRVSDFFKR